MTKKKTYTTPTEVEIREIAAGEFFTLRDYGEFPDESRVYIRGDYDRSEKKYEASKFTDMNHCTYLKPTRKVWVGFTF